MIDNVNNREADVVLVKEITSHFSHIAINLHCITNKSMTFKAFQLNYHMEKQHQFVDYSH